MKESALRVAPARRAKGEVRPPSLGMVYRSPCKVLNTTPFCHRGTRLAVKHCPGRALPFRERQ